MSRVVVTFRKDLGSGLVFPEGGGVALFLQVPVSGEAAGYRWPGAIPWKYKSQLPGNHSPSARRSEILFRTLI